MRLRIHAAWFDAEAVALVRLALARLAPPPSFFMVAIQQPGNSYPPSRLSLLLAGDETRVLDRATRPIQLKVKEALHIEKTPANSRLNRDGGYELPGCWIATMKKVGGGLSHASANRAGATASASNRAA